MPVIKEATAKDRALMGSKSNYATGSSGPLKRKREAGPAENSANSEYYFANSKYLTSPELLDLEVHDPRTTRGSH